MLEVAGGLRGRFARADRDRRDGGRVFATRRHFWRLLRFGTRDRPAENDMAGEAVDP